jgi:hypothetical protein
LDLDPILASIVLATVSLACRKNYWVAATAMGDERHVPGCCQLQQQHHHHACIVSVLASRSLGIVSNRSGTFPPFPDQRFAQKGVSMHPTRLVAHLRYLPTRNFLGLDRPVQPLRRRRLQDLAEGHVARQTPIVHKE